jgi:hypothetical protein
VDDRGCAAANSVILAGEKTLVRAQTRCKLTSSRPVSEFYPAKHFVIMTAGLFSLRNSWRSTKIACFRSVGRSIKKRQERSFHANAVAKESFVKKLGRIGLALASCAVWSILATLAAGQEIGGEKPSEQLLPNSTRAWISVPNPKALNDAFATMQLGQLSHDEQLKPFMDDLREQIRSSFKMTKFGTESSFQIRSSRYGRNPLAEFCRACRR